MVARPLCHFIMCLCLCFRFRRGRLCTKTSAHRDRAMQIMLHLVEQDRFTSICPKARATRHHVGACWKIGGLQLLYFPEQAAFTLLSNLAENSLGSLRLWFCRWHKQRHIMKGQSVRAPMQTHHPPMKEDRKYHLLSDLKEISGKMVPRHSI